MDFFSRCGAIEACSCHRDDVPVSHLTLVTFLFRFVTVSRFGVVLSLDVALSLDTLSHKDNYYAVESYNNTPYTPFAP